MHTGHTKSFIVKTDTFEGPLSLLLSLIEKRKLFINDIALSDVAQDYLEQVRRAEKYPAKDVSEFILVASTLILIKSKSLLPQIALSDEESEGIEELESRLKKLDVVRHLCADVAVLLNRGFMFSGADNREKARKAEMTFSPGNNINKNILLFSVNLCVKNIPKKELFPEAKVEIVESLDEIMILLSERIKSAFRLKFSDFCGEKSKREMSVGFLALLELVKRSAVEARQNIEFGEIEIEGKEIEVPRYY